MSKQANKIKDLQQRIPESWQPLSAKPEDLGAETVLEVATLCLLTRHISETAASKSLKSLRGFCPDWNELRVSQLQEFEGQIKSKSAELRLEVAAALKTFLHEVFLKRHGFDLEFIREDPTEGARLLSQLNELGGGISHYVLWYATGGELPISLGLLRVLNRSGVLQRTSSPRKAQEALDKHIKPEERALFGTRFGSLVTYCDAKKPTCWECAIHTECPFGGRVVKDWEAQQKRLAAQRAREEEAKRKADEARRRHEERERKKAEAEARRKAERAARQQEKVRRAAQRKALQAERKRLADQKKSQARDAAVKKAAAKKVAAKKAAAKKAAAKKTAAKKAAAKKAAAKKAAAKKATAKKAAAKKTAAKKSAAKKKPAKKKPAKKKPAKKKPAKKKPATKKPATKKPATKKGSAKKAAKKRPATKSKASKTRGKKAQRKSTGRASRSRRR